MIRIIAHKQNCEAAAHVSGANAEHEYKTFDIDCPELEEFLNTKERPFVHAYVSGAEIINDR